MRPHRLRLQAFGPFPQDVEVDLDALAAGGLFLLHGETGAGKTTLLDAIGFALFGKVPGVRGERRLRCDTAPADVRTEVRLEVTLSGRRFRITRSPAQERPKLRGTGTAREQARMLLEEHRGGQWETLSTRIDEASAELEPLLGMSSEQFFQVVLLPQGEFARFLRSSSQERGELLQRLFGTGRFAAAEQWLARRRATSASAVSVARAGVRELASRVAQAAAAELPEELPPGWAEGLLEDADQAERAAADQVQRRTAERDAARSAAETARELAARQRRRREAEEAARAIAARAPEVTAQAREVADAARAAEVAPVLAAAAEAERARAAAVAAEAAARAGLPAVGVPVDAAEPVLRERAEEARRRTGRLEALRGTAEDLERALADERTSGREAAAAKQAVGDLQQRLAEHPALLEAVGEERERAEAAAAALPAARALTARLTEAEVQAGALVAAERERAALSEQHLQARETAQTARESETALREARLTTMLAELADRLEPGAPCEVCGSTTHPDPYEGVGEGVGREAEQRAREVREAAEAEVARVGAALSSAQTAVDGLRARLDEAGVPHALAELAPLLAAARADEQAQEAVAAGLPAARAAVEEVERAGAELARALAVEEQRHASAQERAVEAAQRAARLRARLEGELEGQPDLASALVAASGRAEACEQAAAAAAESARAAAAAATALVRATTAATDAGFAGPDEARAALRDDAWRERAEEALRRHADAEAATAALLADPELAVALEPAAPVADAEQALAEADRALAAAVSAGAEAASRAAQLRALAPELAAARAALAPVEEEAVRVRRMADLCTGGAGNTYKMTLSSFVLAARLEEVAAAASSRLLRMTQGRYSLVHTDGAARGGARSGLGLLARDTWTGQDRDTATLSGGETFLASLALALGLAEVVQQEAGGTRIEALFVDEGFGTLDEDTLDEVMDVLDGLREGGRVVGLVSHVSELRQRIPAQVRVTKGRAGSTLAVVGC